MLMSCCCCYYYYYYSYQRQMTTTFGNVILDPRQDGVEHLLFRPDVQFVAGYDVDQLVNRQQEKLLTFRHLMMMMMMQQKH